MLVNNRVRIKTTLEPKFSIRMLLRKGISVYNIEYGKDYTVFTIDAKSIEDLDEETFQIESIMGLKNIFLKLKRNIHFFISIIISLVILVFLSNVCFNVNVIHSDKNIRVMLEDELYDAGIKPFSFKKSFKEIQEIKNRIREEHPNDLEWLEVIDDGMKYTVRVEERIITEKKEEEPYCDVISTRDATVLNIVASKGQMVVGPQDFIKKGAVLISGDVKFNEEVKAQVCASGKVYGNTWYKTSISIPYRHEEKTYTGRKSNNIGFEFGSNYNRIFKVHFDKYDVTKTPLFKLGRFALYKENVQEYESEFKNYTKEEALEAGKKEAREHLKINLGEDASILSEKVLQTSEYNSIISIEIFYSVKEVISTTVTKEITGNKEELE